MLVGAVDAAHDLHTLGSVALVHWAELVAAAAHSVGSNCLELHSDVKTLLEATIWTAFALRFVDMAAAIGNA